MERGHNPIGYHRWSKDKLKKYVDENMFRMRLPVLGAAQTRQDYIKYITDHVKQFRNLRNKSKSYLEDLAHKYEITISPTGRRGGATKADLLKAIQTYWQPEIRETVRPVDFEGNVPRSFTNAYKNFEIPINRNDVDYKFFSGKTNKK